LNPTRVDLCTLHHTLLKEQDDCVYERDTQISEPPCWWITPKNLAPGTTRTILYFHGGGFTFGKFDDIGRLDLGPRLARVHKTRVCFVDFTLLPEKSLFEVVHEALAAYLHLIHVRALFRGASISRLLVIVCVRAQTCGIPSEQIVVAGMTSGATIALWMLLWIRDRGLPTPEAALLFSPVTDFTLSGDAQQTQSYVTEWFVRRGVVP
jgi:acetyl esterase/lipase